jgi:hypothetical protein
MHEYLDCLRVGWRDVDAGSDLSCPAGYELPRRIDVDKRRLLACVSHRDTDSEAWALDSTLIYKGDSIWGAVPPRRPHGIPCYAPSPPCSNGNSEGSTKDPAPCNPKARLHVCLKTTAVSETVASPLPRPATRYLRDRRLLP